MWFINHRVCQKYVSAGSVRQGHEKQVLCFNREDCACLLHNLMFLLYGFKFHIKLSLSHLVNKGGSSSAGGGGSSYRFWQRLLCPDPRSCSCKALSAQIHSLRKPLLSLWTKKKLQNKGNVYIPTQHFIAVKGVWEGQGCLSFGDPMHPRFLSRLCWAPQEQLEGSDNFSLEILHPSTWQPTVAADPPCPWELWSLRNTGFAGGTQFFKEFNPQKNIVTEELQGDRDPPMLLLYGLSTFCVFPPDPNKNIKLLPWSWGFLPPGPIIAPFQSGFKTAK